MATGLIQSLHAQRTSLKAEGDAILTLATAAGGYTDEQREKRDSIIAQIQRIDGDIAAETALRDALRDEPALAIADGGAGGLGADTGKPLFGSLGEQLQAIARAGKTPQHTDPRLWQANARALGVSPVQAATGGSETVGFDGGFAVETQYAEGILQRIYGGSQVAQYCDRRQVGPGANGVAFNLIDETSRATGSRGGGVRGYWIAEGASLTASRPKLARQELLLGKLAALYYATDEELQDVVALESFTDAEFVDELAFLLDDAIINGTGSGIPRGILNAPATVSITKETGQAAATIVPENIYKMWAAATARSLDNAAFYINQTVWPQIFQLGAAVGTGGQPMFIPAGRITDAPGGTLLGRPIRPIEQAAAVGTVGDIILADMSQYLLIEKGAVQRASSLHVQFLTDETAFRWILRVNGRPKLLSALTPYKGSQTQSAFVTLATRS